MSPTQRCKIGHHLKDEVGHRADRRQPQLVTISDIFFLSIKSSHFTLIACASASEAVQQGDELLGIVSVLLSAGVVGTMWPIDNKTGRLFFKLFIKYLHAGTRKKCDNVDIAIALQQTVKELRKGRKAKTELYHWAPFVTVY